jgi:hypothetical protein
VCSTDRSGDEALVTTSDLPPEVRIATECSAALDRGDKDSARRLAERGLQLATATRSPTWIRRFEHLLRAATGRVIEGSPAVPPSCTFCKGVTLRTLVAGTQAFICDVCVERCSSSRIEGSDLERLVAEGIWCSFCSKRGSPYPVFAANGYYICAECVDVCREIMTASPE